MELEELRYARKICGAGEGKIRGLQETPEVTADVEFCI
jgi:hypothetical protein